MIVDCQWSSYGDWSQCSKTCGGGTKTAERTIIEQGAYGGKECNGTALKIEKCNVQPCSSKFTFMCSVYILNFCFSNLFTSILYYLVKFKRRLHLVRLGWLVRLLSDLWRWNANIEQNNYTTRRVRWTRVRRRGIQRKGVQQKYLSK